MSRMTCKMMTAAALAAAVTISFAWAQQPQTVRVRGTIERLEGGAEPKADGLNRFQPRRL